MIAVHNLTFAYGRHTVFSGLSFEVKPGSATAVFGPNGTGKSTLCRILCGAMPPTGGTVTSTGRIGYVPQGDALLMDATVGENLRFFRDLAGGGGVPLPEALAGREKTLASALSGGLRKQLSIACALFGDPDTILFDEPCASLDLSFRDVVARVVADLLAAGRSVVYVGHDPAEFSGFADNVILMEENPLVLSRESLVAGDIPAGYGENLRKYFRESEN